MGPESLEPHRDYLRDVWEPAGGWQHAAAHLVAVGMLTVTPEEAIELLRRGLDTTDDQILLDILRSPLL